MGTSPYAPKLTEQQRYELIRQLAEFKSVPEVQQFAKAEWGIEITAQTIRGYLHEKKWRPLLDRCRQEWAAGIVEIPLAHKRVRLEKLQKLFDDAEEDYAEAKNEQTFLRLIDLQLKILDQARREMEETKTNFTNIVMTQYEQYTDEELIRRMDELLAKIKQWKLPNKTIDNTRPEQGETT